MYSVRSRPPLALKALYYIKKLCKYEHTFLLIKIKKWKKIDCTEMKSIKLLNRKANKNFLCVCFSYSQAELCGKID